MRALLIISAIAAGGSSGCFDVCDGKDAVDGTVTLRSQDDVDKFAGQCVKVNLIVGAENPTSPAETNDTINDLTALAELQIVEGNFYIEGNNVLASVSLPKLTFVGRRLIDPSGENIRASFFIEANNALTDIQLPALTDVGGCFGIGNNVALDPSIPDAIFKKTRTHGFPIGNDCKGGVEGNFGNGTGAAP